MPEVTSLSTHPLHLSVQPPTAAKAILIQDNSSLK